MINLILIAVGAFLYRDRGHGDPVLPSPVPEILLSLIYAVYTFNTWVDWQNGFAPYVAAIVFSLTWWALAKGHGRGLGLDEPMKAGAKPEDIEWPILWLEKRLPTYWYKALIMAVSGLTYTLPVGIATLNPVIALSGIMKAPAYMIALRGSDKGAGKTTAGEMLTGAFLWGAI